MPCVRAPPSVPWSSSSSRRQVLAPAAGRVLKVPLTNGTVVLAGDPSPRSREQKFMLRLRVPERHARFLKVGDPIRVDGERAWRSRSAQFGIIRLIYPQIEEGRVVADAQVDGLGDYFVGDRVRVWISAGDAARPSSSRQASSRPGSAWTTCGVAQGGRTVIDVPVQRGRELPRPDMPDGIEILSGVGRRRRAGAAVNLGLSGRLTQATIRSPLTPLFLLAALAVGLVALLTIPREEEPQISVPMVDIVVQANGLQGARRGRAGHQAARGHRQGDRRRRARLQPDAGRSRHGDRALHRRHQRGRCDPAGA